MDNPGSRAASLVSGRIERAARGAARAFDVGGGVALVAMLIHVNADVLGRYLFNAPLPMTIEVVSYYYMTAVVFLPLAAVEWRDGHISVEVLTQIMGPRAQALLAALTAAVALAYFAVLAWRTALVAVDKYRIGEFVTGVIALDIWPTRFLVPAGCALIAIAIALRLAALVRGRS